MDDNPGLIAKLATSVGTSEAALRLLISIFLGFPIVLTHRYTLYGKVPNVQHAYFALSGLALNYFNYGSDILHTVVTVIIVYVLLHMFRYSYRGPIIVLSFTMTYLLMGYYMTATDTYDIKWTMPQCVLTLRLSGLAFDLYDGIRPEKELSAENKKVRLGSVPSFLEVLAYSFFPSSFLIGPQFPMQRYRDFVSGAFERAEYNYNSKEKRELPNCLTASFNRTMVGLAYLLVFQVGSIYFTDDYLLSPEFEERSFVIRCSVLGIWGHLALYKYISVWLLVEAVCIASGITYNGLDDKGNAKWNGLSNINLRLFESTTLFGHYIEAFNINTNHWVAQYIYKRLKFLGNRQLSQLGVLIFLAVWHGLHSGYYMCFFLEFICMIMEKDIQQILQRNGTVPELLSKPGMKELTWVVLKVYTWVFMGYCMAPFVLLSYHKWWRVHKSFYFMGHILWMPWYLYRPVVKTLFPSKERKEKAS